MTSIRTIFLSVLSLVLVSSAWAEEPRRIVSLGGGVTEILYRLDLGDRIIGVDTTSVYPPEALNTKSNLGYVRTLSAEGILSLKPDLVIADSTAGPPHTLTLVEQAGVKIIRVPEGLRPEDVRARIMIVSEATGQTAKRDNLLGELDQNLQKITETVANSSTGKKVLFVLSISNGKVMVGGTGTSVDALLGAIGMTNAAASVQGWKPLSEEGIIASAPDIILMMDYGQGPGEKINDLFALPAFAATPAARTKSLVTIDGPHLLNYGPRTPVAALQLLNTLNSPSPSGKIGGP